MYNPCIQISIILFSIVYYQSCFGLENARPLGLMDDTNNVVRGAPQWDRRGRTLLNQFPFNQGAHHQSGHHGGHGDHHGHDDRHAGHGTHGQQGFHNGFPQLHQGFGNAQRFSRQGAANGNEIEDAPIDIGTVAAAGERCVEKVMMIEETKYDDSIECHHSYDERCHTTYTTDYVPQQVEHCDENFVKECHIEYENEAFNESVQICNERPVRDCQGKEGPITCETVYETECATSYHLHEVEEDSPNCKIQIMEKCQDVTQGYSTKEECDKWPQQVCELERKVVQKYSPDTQCSKTPRQLCGPGACPVIAGPKECRNEMKTIVQEVPKERCSLRAQPYCEFETKLVPVLKPVDNCVDVPKEVCVRMRTNPRKVKRPVIKKWCYVPTQESGPLIEENDENKNPDTDSSNDETVDNIDNSGDSQQEDNENSESDSDEVTNENLESDSDEVNNENSESDSEEVNKEEASVDDVDASLSSNDDSTDESKDDSAQTITKRRRKYSNSGKRRRQKINQG